MYIGDLHIHSRYSRATSRDCTPEYLDLWARKKGIDIVGTGDFTHPAWREELKEKLEPAEDGLYTLKDEYRIHDAAAPDNRRPRFVVTGEISSIYKKKDKVRKVHSLLLLPGLEDADRLARRLELIGNIHSDGRPILGLDCRDLLEIMLETSPEALYVPAHIWTPHFSMFGAFSGFDAIEDCYEDMTPYIHALETGLSSDPPMNWRISALDSYQLISNSDAHSPAKLGREANLFEIPLSFSGFADAITTGNGLQGTIEFFPEEGKYHFDGHRKCSFCISPAEALSYGNICPVCGKKLTIGVLHRVEQLADREEGFVLPQARPFESLVPLPEVIAASTGKSASSKKVLEQYEKLLGKLGSEFDILRIIPEEDIKAAAGAPIAEGIKRLREGRVDRTPGFDGEYGTISLLTPSEISSLEGQLSFFIEEGMGNEDSPEKIRSHRQTEVLRAARPEGGTSVTEEKNDEEHGAGISNSREGNVKENSSGLYEEAKLNPGQEEAVRALDRVTAVIAGPGSGKTKTLISRISYLLKERGIAPASITAVTFTNKAAEEMRSRLERLSGGKRAACEMNIGTFHGICSRFLTSSGLEFMVADEGLQEELAEKAIARYALKLSPSRFLREISNRKCSAAQGESPAVQEESRVVQEGSHASGAQVTAEAAAYYQELLAGEKVLDYDDLLLETLQLFRENPGAEAEKQFQYLLVDEFQDINPVQYELLKAWNRNGRELFVIGDPDQSIYGFRGSDAGCFSRLEADYPQIHTVRLEENYRSAPAVLESALSLISHNDGEKRWMHALAKEDALVRVVEASGEMGEAIFTAKEINRLIGGIDMLDVEENHSGEQRRVRSFSDIAVLYRTHRQAQLLEKCLRQEGIPYVVAGREDFLLEKNVRGTLYFFQYVLHPEDEAAGQLCLRLLWPPEEKTVEEQLMLLISKYKRRIHKDRTEKLLENWIKDRKLEESGEMEKLVNAAVLYPEMEHFLETLSLGAEGDIRRSGSRRFPADAVTLMTLHGSKGLEFPAVFIYGIRKGLLPLELGTASGDVQEERRLLYVGMTRAREELILTFSGEPSMFLGEIPEKFSQREQAKKEKPVEEAVQLSLFDFMV